MQVLPFVFALIMLFSLTVGFFFHSHLNSRLFHEGLKAKERALHHAKNTQATKEYRQAARTPKAPKPQGPSIPQGIETDQEEEALDEENLAQDETVYFREWKCLNESQKFNLSLLQKEGPGDVLKDDLFKAAARMIKKLYEHTPFYTEGCESDILAELLTQKDLKLPWTLENPSLDKIFYQMQRGTSTYDVTTHEGFPSFWDYFTLSNKQTLSFPHLSKVVLEEIIDSRLLKIVLTQEKKTNKPLKYKELKDLLTTHPELHSLFLPLDKIFEFSKTKKTEEDASIDLKSGMVVRD